MLACCRIEACARLVHDMYVRRGIMPADPSGLRVTAQLLHPATAVFVARRHGRVIGTRDVIAYFICYLRSPLGNLIGTCGELLTTLGLPSGLAWLLIVSMSRMNFSASMGLYSLKD